MLGLPLTLNAIRKAAKAKGVKVLDVTQDRVRKTFTPTKDMIASSIAGRFPELGPQLPAPRKSWGSEAHAMPIFDAMAFAQTFFYFRKRKQAADERAVLRQVVS